jgi:hypothetical protein
MHVEIIRDNKCGMKIFNDHSAAVLQEENIYMTLVWLMIYPTYSPAKTFWFLLSALIAVQIKYYWPTVMC